MASPRPITITTDPTTTGGSSLSIQSVPNFLMSAANTTYISPAAIIPPIAAGRPCCADTAVIGAINAKDDPT